MRTWTAQRLTCLLSILFAVVTARKHEPLLQHTEFESPITDLLYFDNSDVIIFPDFDTGKIWRSVDAGFTWKLLEELEEALEIVKHTYNPGYAIALGPESTHYITKDQGETWSEFTLANVALLEGRPLAFHATDPDRILIQARECLNIFECVHPFYYTLDGFETEPQLLHEDASTCLWAKTTEQFTTNDDDLDLNRILCNVRGAWSFFEVDSRILISDDFFETSEEPLLDADRAVSGIISIASVTGYLATAAKSVGSDELALYITDDTQTWHRAEFGDHKIEQAAYTILESTNYSIQIDVQSGYFTPIGTLFTSNSNGTFFTKNIEHTNRNLEGYVDFEKIQNIQGVVMVNVVSNFEAVDTDMAKEKDIVTRISFDDGRTWQPMSFEDEDLHLHSVTDQINTGRIFSSPAPGIVMGVGNTGKSLKARKKGNTYISDDAGVTWTMALKKPHLYEMGGQGGLLVAIEDESTDIYQYSTDHGATWEKGKLEHKVEALALTTVASSTSLKFLLIAKAGKDAYEIIALDFSGLKERTCSKKDLEEWYARVDADGEPQCNMGHTTMFNRRKADADCLVDEDDISTAPILKHCECTQQDYECDFNFVNNNGTCVPTSPIAPPKGECDKKTGTFLGASGYRLIPGNTCEGGLDLEEPIERKCKDTTDLAPSGDLKSTSTAFPKSKNFLSMYYLERCETCQGDDETIIALSDRSEVWISYNHGKEWVEQKFSKDTITRIYPHQYFNDQVYLLTDSKKVYYSKNRGQSFHHFDAPSLPPPLNSGIYPLSFHPNQTDWLIWTGDNGDEYASSYSRKRGDDWHALLRDTRKCDFIYREGRASKTELVYCEQNDEETDTRTLMASEDWFEDDKRTLKHDVISFATMAEFIVVAIKDEDKQTLKLDASVDGTVFADAQFPKKFEVDHQTGYTVLSSNTHAIMVHVTVNSVENYQYGAIIKSNSNGTNYVMSIRHVNRNNEGYVDFEKVQGLEGVAIVNVVDNPEEVNDRADKKLKTMITHNDGAEWALIPRPATPAAFDVDWCSGDVDDCSLHLHGYTERDDPRDTFSSPTAIGLLVASGNVGEQLGDIATANTFMSRDAGVVWEMIEEGSWFWKYGDRGSIIVIIKKGEAVTDLKYTLDEGNVWALWTFSDKPVTVNSLTTLPSDTSRNFLVTGHIGEKLVTINIDFSGLEERSEKCFLDEKNRDSDADDYELWSPEHPLSKDSCLFGHVAEYHRKIPDRPCYNGQRLPVLHSIAKNCECTRQDFECDYNYERQTDGSCSLVPGLSPQPAQDVCSADPDLKEYHDITGYRRIPLTTCAGGLQLDGTLNIHPCPGFEDDPDTHHGPSGVGLFFAIVVPIAAAAAVGWYVYRNWDGKFGRIQLGDGAAGSRIGLGGAFDRDAPWIRYPVLAVSAVVAVVAAIPLLVSSVFRTVQTRFGRSGGRFGSYSNRPFTSRGSFQRNRGNYSVVDPDEGELLGDESEDEEA